MMHNEITIKKLDNGGFLMSYEVKKKNVNTKNGEYPYERKEMGYETMEKMMSAMKKNMMSGMNKHDEYEDKVAEKM